MYAEVVAAAKKADGHRLLRVTEIFGGVEYELKYSSSPRILFETAVLKASMPKEDYDIESLLSRISALEKALENGEFSKNDGGRAEMNVQTPVSQSKQERVQTAAVEEPPTDTWDEYVPPEMDAPPDETELGGRVYFDEPPQKPAAKPVEKPVEKPQAPTSPKTAKPLPAGDAKAVFGLFLRCLRKIARSGVLITLCMDLDCEYDGDTFVLTTASDTIYRSLKKEEHYALIAQAFDGIGIQEGGFDVRLKGKKTDTFNKGVNAIKETFGGVNVEIK